MRDRLRVRHYSVRTEQAYVSWIRRFILANGKRHPRQMEQADVEAFLTRLAIDGQVSAGMQNQALATLLFLYREVLRIELPWMEIWCVPSGRGAFLRCSRAKRGVHACLATSYSLALAVQQRFIPHRTLIRAGRQQRIRL